MIYNWGLFQYFILSNLQCVYRATFIICRIHKNVNILARTVISTIICIIEIIQKVCIIEVGDDQNKQKIIKKDITH